MKLSLLSKNIISYTAKTILLFTLLNLCQADKLEFENDEGCGRGCQTCKAELDICTLCGIKQYYDSETNKCRQTTLEGCKYFLSRNKCLECEEGYKLSNYQCFKCEVQNCKFCNVDVNLCVECFNSFTSSTSSSSDCNLRCSAQNCKTCNKGSPTSCQTCLNGFRKDNLFNCVACIAKGCITCKDDPNQCDYFPDQKSCQNNFYFFNKKCLECEKGCKLCNRHGICLRCNTETGFWMFRDMICKRAFIVKDFLMLFFFLIWKII